MTRRIVNAVLVLTLGVALVVLAAVVTVEVVRALLDDPPLFVPWPDWWSSLSSARVDDVGTVTLAVMFVLVGLALMIWQSWPARPSALELEPVEGSSETVISRRGTRHAATTAAEGVAGVGSASTKVRRRRLAVSAHTQARDEGLDDLVVQAVEQRLDALGVRKRPKVSVDLHERG